MTAAPKLHPLPMTPNAAVIGCSAELGRRAKAVQRAKEWATRNPERRKAIERRYRAKKTRTAYFRRYYVAHREQYATNKRRWETTNRRKCSQQVGQRLIRDRAELKEWYIRRLLSEGNSVPPSVWPASLVKAKRAELKLQRLWLKPRASKTSTN
jgi:hypothetical protein